MILLMNDDTYELIYLIEFRIKVAKIIRATVKRFEAQNTLDTDKLRYDLNLSTH